jgi:hypothetical protein
MHDLGLVAERIRDIPRASGANTARSRNDFHLGPRFDDRLDAPARQTHTSRDVPRDSERVASRRRLQYNREGLDNRLPATACARQRPACPSASRLCHNDLPDLSSPGVVS